MKRKWLAIPLATGLLAAGLTGASALAHSEDGENDTPRETVAGKVAEILGIDDEQSVKDAIQLATQEVHLEQLQHRLDHMVEAGVLTQDQADAYLDWYEARPDGPNLHRNGHRLFEFNSGDGDQDGPRQGSGQSQFRGQRFGGQDFPGQGQRPDRGEGSDASQLPNGKDFPGQGELRSRFGQRFGGQEFPGQGQLPPGLGGEVPYEAPDDLPDAVPEGSGTSF